MTSFGSTAVCGRDGALKNVASRPLLLRVSFAETVCDLERGAAVAAGNLMVLVRRVEGLVMYTRCGSRADMLLDNFGTSSLRSEADRDPERGVCSVRFDEPPSSLLLFPDDLLTVTSSTTARDLGRP